MNYQIAINAPCFDTEDNAFSAYVLNGHCFAQEPLPQGSLNIQFN